MSSISIIIRCYNEERHIGRLLTGISQQTLKDPEIIIVDSGSTDNTLEVASLFPVRIISIPSSEFSFGRSLNIGCKAATSEILVIGSAHIYPAYDDWLEKLVQPFSDPRMVLVYGKQTGGQTTKFSEKQLFKTWFGDQSDPNQDHPFCNNANAAIRREMWEKMIFDETLTGLEDLDWAKRAMKKGHRLAYQAEAEIIHVHDEVSSQIYNRYRREAFAMRQIYPETRFSLFDFIRLAPMNILADWYSAIHEKCFWREFAGIVRFRLLQFWGTYRGNHQHGPVNSRLKQKFYFPGQIRRQSNVVETTENSRNLITYSNLPADPSVEENS